uniref:Uncharacterized protein n=1 Tax=Arundo donax TaxID=35708 RepID=A0A0A8Y719_ARUDO
MLDLRSDESVERCSVWKAGASHVGRDMGRCSLQKCCPVPLSGLSHPPD